MVSLARGTCSFGNRWGLGREMNKVWNVRFCRDVPEKEEEGEKWEGEEVNGRVEHEMESGLLSED